METQTFLDALAAGDAATVRDALAAEPSLANARTASGSSALQWATYTGHSDLVPVLLDAGATVDVDSACTIGRIDSIPPDADPNGMSPDGFRRLALAAAFGHNEIVRLLLQQGADANLRSTALGGVAPLHSAVFGRNSEAVRLLVEAGAEVDTRQEGGFTALMGAAQNGDTELVRFLLDHGADPSLRTDEDKSAADLAANEEIRTGLINGFE